MKNGFYYNLPQITPEKLFLVEENGMLLQLTIDAKIPINDIKIKETKVLNQAFIQLREYFSGERKTFNLPLNPTGTAFQKKVWQNLCKIPYGKVISYKELAVRVGNYKACRAVGMANNKNPLPIIIPCHRVVGQNGTLTGYAYGLNMKKYLLELEGIKVSNNKILQISN